jgi:hypothetical protein
MSTTINDEPDDNDNVSTPLLDKRKRSTLASSDSQGIDLSIFGELIWFVLCVCVCRCRRRSDCALRRAVFLLLLLLCLAVGQPAPSLVQDVFPLSKKWFETGRALLWVMAWVFTWIAGVVLVNAVFKPDIKPFCGHDWQVIENSTLSTCFRISAVWLPTYCSFISGALFMMFRFRWSAPSGSTLLALVAAKHRVSHSQLIVDDHGAGLDVVDDDNSTSSNNDNDDNDVVGALLEADGAARGAIWRRALTKLFKGGVRWLTLLLGFATFAILFSTQMYHGTHMPPVQVVDHAFNGVAVLLYVAVFFLCSKYGIPLPFYARLFVWMYIVGAACYVWAM